ncbi:spinster family MFS transporter [Kordiimonas aestuarii]|uniref:spinster family MFS transporter n=1 Tax=Kordiimonas aestuarii TaxID=1005925 RepID=UPI0021CFC8C3|nr:MFS transporter [Kordiimonas aestuarii]
MTVYKPDHHNSYYRWFVLAMLCLVYAFNFLDRQLLGILSKPIQDELSITDSELGRLGGLYFALFYCAISIPIAWFADRANRARIVALACAIWSAATVACGLSRSYSELIASRMAVGIGEAGGLPPSYSIISDYFPAERRGTALSILNLGPPIGQSLGVAVGATIAATYDWRSAFIAIGSAGILVAALVVVTVREPRRGAMDVPMATPHRGTAALEEVKFSETLKMFFRRRVLYLAGLASGAANFISYAIMNFAILFLMREKGMTLQDVGLYYAPLVAVALGAGIYLSGWLIDRYGQKSRQAYALIPAVTLACAIPFFFGFVHAETWPVAMAFLAMPLFLNSFFLSPAIAVVQNAVSSAQRALSGALLLLVMNLIGLGFGPTYLGAMSDFFRTSYPGHSLQLAFYSLIPFYILAIGLHVLLARALRREQLSEAKHKGSPV